jgi:methylated-DNA-[protein]-cysteine S-methyltransferase
VQPIRGLNLKMNAGIGGNPGNPVVAANMIAFTLFDAAIGRCAIAWGHRGIVALQFAAATDAATRQRILKRHGPAREAVPSPDILHAVQAVVALLGGAPVDTTAIILDMDGVPAFDRHVYQVTRTIPVGTTLTYGNVAAQLGDRRLARSVGQALGRNPIAVIVPCHRVVAAGGRAGGFSAPGGVAIKRRLLAIEAAAVVHPGPLFAPR